MKLSFCAEFWWLCEYIRLCEFTLVSFPQACGVGGMRKRQELPAIEDRDKPYVCDSEREHLRSSFSIQSFL